jgi:tetratricopeptide (TPR) repeat protein
VAGMKHKIRAYEGLIVAGMLFLMLLIGGYQKTAGRTNIAGDYEKLNYLPSGFFLKGMALGYDEALADFLWVRTVGYFGAHVKTDQDYTWLIHMLKLTTELDPRYESPYEFAGIILPSELNKVDEGITFLEKGIQNIPRHNPRYWLQHFYLGFCYMIYKHNPEKAAQHFKVAATFPRSPDWLPLLIARLYASGQKHDSGIAFIQKLLGDPDNQIELNEHMRNSLLKRLKELVAAEHIAVMGNAVSEYTGTYGQHPSDLDDLVDGLILPFIPIEPFGGVYYLSLTGDEIFSTQSEGELQIHESDGDELMVSGTDGSVDPKQ